MSPKRGLIYGSCVSRDLIENLSGEIVAKYYFPRQSWISAFSGPTEVEVPEANFSSAFQYRCLKHDFAGDAFDKIKQKRPEFEFLILDLVDERAGVLRVEEGIVTNNWELYSNHVIGGLKIKERIPMGSEQHKQLWECAAEQFYQELKSLELLEKTILIRPEFTSTVVERPGSSDLVEKCEELTQTFQWYYDLLEGWDIKKLYLPPEKVASSDNHRWGLTPFHYENGTTELMKEKIIALLNPDKQIDD